MMNDLLNIQGRLVSLDSPRVMGILNVTPDSFYADSRKQTEQQIADRVRQMVSEGADFIDVGACSTRPGSSPVSEAEESERLRMALSVIRATLADVPAQSVILSIDTFRPAIARMCVEEYGAHVINDVSEGSDEMFRAVAQMGVPYILMSVQPDLRTTLLAFAEKVQRLRDYGQKDIILDPGFGFGKTLEQNYQLFSEMEKLQVMELPLLVGISRKSMIHKTLCCTPDEALNGTTFLNTVALMKGASILRVHDVKEAVECCRLYAQLKPINSEVKSLNS